MINIYDEELFCIFFEIHFRRNRVKRHLAAMGAVGLNTEKVPLN